MPTDKAAAARELAEAVRAHAGACTECGGERVVGFTDDYGACHAEQPCPFCDPLFQALSRYDAAREVCSISETNQDAVVVVETASGNATPSEQCARAGDGQKTTQAGSIPAHGATLRAALEGGDDADA